jgi:hypothetical protein
MEALDNSVGVLAQVGSAFNMSPLTTGFLRDNLLNLHGRLCRLT